MNYTNACKRTVKDTARNTTTTTKHHSMLAMLGNDVVGATSLPRKAKPACRKNK